MITPTIHRILVLLTLLNMAALRAEIIPQDPLIKQCAAKFVATPPLPLTVATDEHPASTLIAADTVEVTGQDEKTYTFNGAVSMQRDTQWLQSNRVVYRNSNADASGDVRIWQNNLLVTGATARYSFSDARGALDDAQFFLPTQHARGNAQRINLHSNTSSTLQRSTYTACEVNDEAWHLNARTLTLDTAENVGTATHVWVDFMQVPILYFPYLNFPLSGRKSGLLFPAIGRSKSLGTSVVVPFYWNIAPHRDATITLKNYTARGQQWLGEFRYLNPHSSGQLNFEYLGHDKVAATERSFVAYQHHWNPAARWVADANYRYASDKDYFREFGDRLSTSGIVHLERNALLAYRGDQINAQARVLEYQTLDAALPPTSRPYRILPEVTLLATPGHDYYFTRWQVQADAVRFEHSERLSGTRLHAYPSMSVPLEGMAGFIKPKLGMHHTQYQLEQQAADSDAQASLTTPVFSLDSGIFFERELDFGGAHFLQTLEPRLFFLYAPYRDQSNFSVFDTGLNSLSYAQLFAENRFSGGDRVGDARQVTLALSSRLLDPAGVERGSISLGRIYYGQDRKVNLGSAVETDPRSNIIAEARAHPITDLDVTASTQWNYTLEAFTQNSVLLRYQPDKRKIINIGLRTDRNALGEVTQHETELSFFWPVATHWNIIGRRNYSVLYHLEKERLVGVEYDSCCWALSVVRRSYVSNTKEADWFDRPEIQARWWLQLELKGLSNIGQNIESLLENVEHGITGY